MAAFFICCPSIAKGLSSIVCRSFSVATTQRIGAKVYFAASIRAGRDDAKIYKDLIDYIKLHGRVLSESEQLGPNIDQEAKGILILWWYIRDAGT